MMRYTLIGERRGISFVASRDTLPILVAACAHDPLTVDQFLDVVGQYNPAVQEYVTSGLAVFDEHNVPENLEHIRRALSEAGEKGPTPVFRIVDDVTRAASLESFKWGLILFNVPMKRIIQLQNTYQQIRREGRVMAVGTGGAWRARSYRLPPSWRIVP